jgi:DNA polymerase-3 subunit gamma/tau
MLVKHLEGIAAKENVQVEPDALALIARAAEGSVRDSLSLLDQAIAHSGGAGQENAAGTVRAEDVRQMLGLADRVRIVDLFEALMKGDMAAALKELREQYDIGADPAVVLADLAEFTHFVTRVKVVPAVADDVSLSEAERVRGKAFATQLSMRVLARAWQMLLKGMAEVKDAARPLAAAEMMLVRIAYAADLPTPDEVVRSVTEGGGGNGSRPSSAGSNGGGTVAASTQSAPRYDAPRGAPRGSGGGSASAALSPRPVEQPAAQNVPTLALNTLDEIIALAAEKRDVAIKMALERDVRLVRCEDGKLELALEKSAARTLINDLSRKLSGWTNKRWMVIVSAEQGAPTVKAQNDQREADLKRGVRGDPLVQAVLSRFPGAEIVSVSQPDALVADAPPADPDPETESD